MSQNEYENAAAVQSELINIKSAAVGILEEGVSAASSETLKTELANLKACSISGNTAGNITSCGVVAIKGEWIYYKNIGDGNKLYKISADDSKNPSNTYQRGC